MTDLTLLHLSDLHFASENPSISPDRALQLVAEATRGAFGDDPIVLALSGDVTTGGQPGGFDQALQSIRRHLLKKLNIEKVVVCPGNHDIVAKDRLFVDFNKFARALTETAGQSWGPDTPVRVETINQYKFILINSSYMGDYSVGEVPLQEVREALRSARDSNVIVLIHHSPISSSYGAGLSLSYELLSLVAEEEAVALLHGHVHSDQGLLIGKKPTLVAGVGSLAFRPAGNMNNQFSIYKFHSGVLESSMLFKYYENRGAFELAGRKP